MKKLFFSLILAIALLLIPSSAGAFNITPMSPIELDIPADGSATRDFIVSDFEGTLLIELENLPLEFEPHEIEVMGGQTFTVTFYGDGTNNSYEGKILFRPATDSNVVIGYKVRVSATIYLAVDVPNSANLTVTILEPAPSPTPSPPTGDGVSPTHYADMTLFGIEGRFLIRDGEIVRKIEAISEDGMLAITIPKGTIALDKDGRRLKGLEVAVDKSPPDPPEDIHIIGLAYDFGPDGATFDPPITFTWRYDPDALPEDVAEDDLVLAYYDEAAGEWRELDCVVDTENNTIIASVEHFTAFAILGAVTPPPVPVPPVPEPPAPPPVLEPPVVTIPEPVPAPVVPEPTPVPAPVVPEPTPPAPPVEPVVFPTWAIVLIAVGAAIIAGLVYWFIRKRERAY